MDSLIFSYRGILEVDGFSLGDVESPPSLEEVPAALRQLVTDLWRRAEPRCPHCGHAFQFVPFAEKPRGRLTARGVQGCTNCGFWYLQGGGMGLAGEEIFYATLALLKSFRVDDPNVGIAEIARYLSRRVSDVFVLPPRRFEELVAQVYRDLGYTAILTQTTCDGGYDVILLDQDSSQGDDAIIVECKRYAQDRTVSVGLVRQLLGVQLVEGRKRAKLVATTKFSRAAAESAKRLSSGSSGYELELVDLRTFADLLRLAYWDKGSSPGLAAGFPRNCTAAGEIDLERWA